jgi:insulysin
MIKKYFLSVYLCILGLFLSPVYSEGYTVIKDEAKIPLLTPDFAQRKTLKIRLDNGLEAILVSDPLADKSSAMLSVKAGSWEDPEEYPGIAHFLEHMLFLGTKKYPHESEYQRYISEHGGTTNAFTANHATSYMFSVNNDAFPEALDRFSNFFKEPLFCPSGVARELRAIDQEYAKNLDNDDIRQMFVIKALTNPKHPNYRFNIGNSSTLSNVSQSTLIDWYKAHYSANLMRLIVYSPLSLEKITSLVLEDFGGIANTNKAMLKVEASPDIDSMKAQLVYIEPVKNIRTLTLLWNLPSKFSEMIDSKPETLACHVLGHEGKESLLAELKHQKLAESLRCGGVRIGPGLLSFYLDIGLTDAGVADYELVITRCFQAIANFRKKGLSLEHFQEIQRMETIRYQYQAREDAFDQVMRDAGKIFDEPIASYPEKSFIVQKFDPKALKELLNFLTPESCRFFMIAPSTLTGVQPDQTEKWLGVNFAVRPISNKRMDIWTHIEPFTAIDLPALNTFIPSKLELLSDSKDVKEDLSKIPHPKVIMDNEMGKIFFSQDYRYRIPRVKAGNASKVVLGDLFVKYLIEDLSKFSYNAAMAGLEYDLQRTENGIAIIVQGYNENAHLLFDEILNRIKEFSPTEGKFEIYKQSLFREFQNFSKETPVKQAANVFKSIVYKNFTTEKQKASALKELNYKDFKEYTASVFDQVYINGLLYGNMTEVQAKTVSNKLLTTLKAHPYPKEKQLIPEVIVLPSNEGPFYVENIIPVQGNAVLLAVEKTPYSFNSRAAQQILMQALFEPFFTDLRTKQQTGYLVYCTGEEIERQMFNLFIVQSNTHEVRDLLARFELFIESYLQEINSGLPEESFQNIKKALVEELIKGPQSIEKMGDLLKTLAFKYDADFSWLSKRIDALNALTYDEFLKEAREFLGRNNKRRLAIMVKGIIPEDNVFDYQRIDNIQQIRRMSTYVGNEKEEVDEEALENH